MPTTNSHKVLFAEASKEVVDFRFSFLSLHVATVTRLLSTDATSSNIKAGYVKGGVIYMIMDNLEVNPMTTESSVAVLQKFNVKGIDALQVKEGLKLVKASLESNTALTNVFLGKKQQKLFNFGPLETSSFRGFILPNLDMTLELLRREGVLFQQGFHA
ncbi:PREDICTED: unnamed product [Prunus dulcis]|uniref:PREDICTED: unnamed product n=1 Tax=Prunus dulcis TaxID=3755 RepID=A0A5E4E9I3_PRUDU|nr:PREDICTED: unnamed product [Prunus dulcis]